MTLLDILGSQEAEITAQIAEAFGLKEKSFIVEQLTLIRRPNRTCLCGRHPVIYNDNPYSLCRKCEAAMGEY